MLDLSRHVPTLYEKLLQDKWAAHNDEEAKDRV
jgi:hypothetical protein